MALFTSGRWTVKPGHEDEFVEAWREFAEWSKANAPGAGWAYLLRDQDHPNVFLTVGPWESAEAIEAWRNSDGFRERIAKVRALLDGFEPETLDSVVEIR